MRVAPDWLRGTEADAILLSMPDPVISAPETSPAAALELTRRQLEALLEVGEAIAQQRDLPALFHDLAERLHSVVDFDFLTLILHDPARNVMRLHILETEHPTEKPVGMELPVDGHPSGWVWQRQETFVVSDTHEEQRYPEYMARLREKGVRAFALVPLTTAQRRLGAMGFGRMVTQRITDGARGKPGGGGGGQRTEPGIFAGVSGTARAGTRPLAGAAGFEQRAGDQPRAARTFSRDCGHAAARDSSRLHQLGVAGTDDRIAEDLRAGFSGA
jgi:hypothetical protein